jgi:hypothetical protein
MSTQDLVINAVVVGTVALALGTLMAGIRRTPWRYAIGIGIGFGLVIGAVGLATADGADPAMLVLVGAIGGALAQLAFERGERERRRISDAVTAIRDVPST